MSLDAALRAWSSCPVCGAATAGIALRLGVVFRRQRCGSCGSALLSPADAGTWRIGASTALLVILVLMVLRHLPAPAGWILVAVAAGIALYPELRFPLRPDTADPITVRAVRRAREAAEGLDPPVSIAEHRDRAGR